MKASTQLLSMQGRCVLITGAAAGIGKAMALRFADAGAELLILPVMFRERRSQLMGVSSLHDISKAHS